MSDRPKINLEYSTQSVEHDAERLEAEHRRHVEDYNEATFGERRPWLGTISRMLIVVGVAGLMAMLLPRRVGEPVALLFVLGFRLWEHRQYS